MFEQIYLTFTDHNKKNRENAYRFEWNEKKKEIFRQRIFIVIHLIRVFIALENVSVFLKIFYFLSVIASWFHEGISDNENFQYEHFFFDVGKEKGTNSNDVRSIVRSFVRSFFCLFKFNQRWVIQWKNFHSFSFDSHI